MKRLLILYLVISLAVVNILAHGSSSTSTTVDPELTSTENVPTDGTQTEETTTVSDPSSGDTTTPDKASSDPAASSSISPENITDPQPSSLEETCVDAFNLCYLKNWTAPIEADSIPDFCEYALYSGNQCMADMTSKFNFSLLNKLKPWSPLHECARLSPSEKPMSQMAWYVSAFCIYNSPVDAKYPLCYEAINKNCRKSASSTKCQTACQNIGDFQLHTSSDLDQTLGVSTSTSLNNVPNVLILILSMIFMAQT